MEFLLIDVYLSLKTIGFLKAAAHVSCTIVQLALAPAWHIADTVKRKLIFKAD